MIYTNIYHLILNNIKEKYSKDIIIKVEKEINERRKI